MKKLLLFALICSACAPQVELTKVNKSKYPSLQPWDAFAFLKDSTGLEDKVYLTDIIIRDAGMTVDCDYEVVANLAEMQARKLGGNCFVLTKHKKPGIASSCHQIRGKVYRISNAEKFEQTILWNPARPLKMTNFRGSTENRPFQAATSYSIQYGVKTYSLAGRTTLYIETRFQCDNSYFKPSADDASLLQHEQLHFDIGEIYARIFRKRLKTEATSYSLYRQKHEEIYAEVWKALRLKQDEYDAEVYTDPAKQTKWAAWVKTELASLEAYAHTDLVIGEE